MTWPKVKFSVALVVRFANVLKLAEPMANATAVDKMVFFGFMVVRPVNLLLVLPAFLPWLVIARLHPAGIYHQTLNDRVVSRQLEKSYLELVPSSQFGQQQTYSTYENGDPKVAVEVASEAFS